MTTTAKPIHRAFVGMTIDQAATFMRSRWNHFLAHKDIPLHPDPVNEPHTIDLRHYGPDNLREDLRDTGWCLGHSGGFNAMAKAHDLAIKGLHWNHQGHDFSLAIDRAFDGIDSWNC